MSNPIKNLKLKIFAVISLLTIAQSMMLSPITADVDRFRFYV